MPDQTIRRFLSVRYGLLMLVAVLGCSGSDALNSPTAARLKKLSTMYLDYAVQRNGGGPASEDVLKKHMKNSDTRTLQANGINKDEIDSLFISERDQQPFVVIYGVGIRQISADSKTVVAYEKTGQKGKRLVAFDSTKVAHVDEAGLKSLIEGAAESKKE